MSLQKDSFRFDRRLITRHLREGTITLEELNEHLASLPDVASFAANPNSSRGLTARVTHAESTEVFDDEGDEEEEDEDEDEDEELE